MLAGQPINFKAYLRNNGDADLTNIQYTVTVYTAQNGVRGDVTFNSILLAPILRGLMIKQSVVTHVKHPVKTAPGEYMNGGESTLKTTDECYRLDS